ncbi:MAG: MFS transporter [Pseudomonadota bacterium]|nr:MAG: MFS transporter [Pseudomonadota bacterium]
MHADSRSYRALRRVVAAEPQEVKALLWSFGYFFCLLCGYYILRPLREEMGIAGGIKNLPWVFTGTFLAMLAAVPLFGALTALFPRRKFLPTVYLFFIVNILIFYALFQSSLDRAIVARAFFIWVSVFNLFVVSVFWSFMVDLYAEAQARRLFGFIAAGGSAGAITGPTITALLAAPVGPINLLLLSAGFLAGAVICIRALIQWDHSLPERAESARSAEQPLGGGVFAGVTLLLRSVYLLGIALFIFLLTMLGTFAYFEQAHIVAARYTDPAGRTALFAAIDLGVNALTITIQLLITGRLLTRFGLGVTLTTVPVITAIGFIGLGVAPILPVLVAFQISRRAGEYAITRPAREVLFTVVGREVKYKTKNFIDTVVFRGGDAVSAWIFAGVKGLGLTLAGIAWLAVPVAGIYIATALWLAGRERELRNHANTEAEPPHRHETVTP